MKRSLLALSLVALATASAAGVPTFSGEQDFDRSLPTYPELGLSAALQVADAYRLNAGDSDADMVVNSPIAAADKWRFDAGESTDGLVVQDYGSA